MTDALEGDNTFEDRTKNVVFTFSQHILKSSFVTFEGAIYEALEGIPTGNCISRQVADCSMQWLLFKELKINTWKLWELVRFWKRFIDDILGRWRGTVRQFYLFVNELNSLAKPFGIQFAGEQIGNSVNYLDVNLYLDNSGQIQYKLFKKETDARNYLSTDSFHPQNVFSSVVFSQMLRVIDRNSSDETCIKDLEDLKSALIASGHSEAKLEETEPLAVERSITNKSNKGKAPTKPLEPPKQSLVFSTKYFQEVSKLKTLVRNIEEDIKQLCGDIRIIFALQKHPSISNGVVRNRRLSEGESESGSSSVPNRTSQACGGKGCKLCPLLFNVDEDIMINGIQLKLDKKLSCKDKCVIYVAQCQNCVQIKLSSGSIMFEDSYFGQTATETNTRFNGHRSKFKIDDEKTDEKSTLSQHCFDCHNDVMTLSIFKVGIVKKCKPCELDREENRFISKFRTDIWGLNRINVIR